MATHPSSLEQLLERQAALWDLRRRAAQEGGSAARDHLAHLAEGPWISISKQLGSGGTDVAARIATQLGWQVFDRQVLEAVARETGSREKILSRLDGRAVGVLEDYLAQLLVPDDPGQPAFLREMVRVVWTIARHGNAVFVGRGANWFLDSRYGLRVRVIAPPEARAGRIAAAEGVPLAEASRRARDDDVAQAKFIRQVYRRDVDDPLGYDLVLNTGALDLDAAAAVVAAALPEKLRAPA